VIVHEELFSSTHGFRDAAGAFLLCMFSTFGLEMTQMLTTVRPETFWVLVDTIETGSERIEDWGIGLTTKRAKLPSACGG
jgi:hypothetical protein